MNTFDDIQQCLNPDCGAFVMPTQAGICPACRRFDFSIGQMLGVRKVEMPAGSERPVGWNQYPVRDQAIGTTTTVDQAEVAASPSDTSATDTMPQEPFLWTPVTAVTRNRPPKAFTGPGAAPIQRARPNDIAKICPNCGGNSSRLVGADDSYAVDRVPYVQCTQCDACFIQCLSRSEWAAMVGVGITLCVVAIGLWPPGLIWTWVAVLLVLSGASAVWFGIHGLLTPTLKPTLVELLPDDELEPETAKDSQPSPEIQQWLQSAASKDRPVIRGIQWLAGNLAALVGGFLVLAEGAYLAAHMNRPNNAPPMFHSFGEQLLFSVVMLVVGGVGLWLSSLGKGLKAAAAPAWKRIKDAVRSPVLYLRSFDDDGHPLWTGSVVERKMDSRHLSSTVEDAVTKVFEEKRLVVAVGRPGQTLPPSGASRAWLGNDEWQSWVEGFIAWSNRVVMFMGSTEAHRGLAWEVRKIFSTCEPHKLILILPPFGEEKMVEARWKGYREILGERFPEYIPDVVAMRFTSNWKLLITTVERYRELPSEDKQKVFVNTLTAFRKWQRPQGDLDVAIKTIVMSCE